MKPIDEPKARRRWWTRKRWIMALLVWSAAAYPLSLGPVAYFGGLGAIDFEAWEELYDPLHNTIGRSAGRSHYWRYVEWWYELGRSTPASTSPPAEEWHPRATAVRLFEP